MAKATFPNSTSREKVEHHQFEHLADAEAFLITQGFALIPGSCDWINEAGDDAGIYPIECPCGTAKAFRVEITRAKGPIITRLSQMIRDPFVAAAFRAAEAAEDDGLGPHLVDVDYPKTLDGGAVEMVPADPRLVTA